MSASGTCSVTMNANRDVSANFTPPATGRGYYVMTGCRLIDTRNSAGPAGGPALEGGATRNIVAGGRCGVSATATALAVNVTAVAPSGAGFLTLFPGPVAAPRPAVSSLSYRTLRTRANNSMAAVGTDGSFNIYNSGALPLHFIIDVYGYFE